MTEEYQKNQFTDQKVTQKDDAGCRNMFAGYNILETPKQHGILNDIRGNIFSPFSHTENPLFYLYHNNDNTLGSSALQDSILPVSGLQGFQTFSKGSGTVKL